jgi:flagellar hook-associated protein 3 FlgL
MRVTNSIITRNSQSRLQTNLQGLDRIRDDISSGIRLRKMSDNPTSGGELVRIGSSMRALLQFKRNVDSGIARASAEENVLDQLTNALTRGIELGIGQASATANAQSRLIVKAEVDQLINFASNLGNTRIGDEYLFGGNRAGEAPFATPAPATGSFSRLTLAGNPVNPSWNITLEIAVEMGMFFCGSAATVREQIAAAWADMRVGHLLAMLQFGTLPADLTERNMRLFASDVMPALRALTGDSSRRSAAA